MTRLAWDSRLDHSLPFWDEEKLQASLSMLDVISALEAAICRSAPADTPRRIVDVRSGQLLLMPSESPGWVGVKISAVAPGNPDRALARVQGMYLLMDADTLVPTALLDGVALTNLRTPAISAISAVRLAIPEARELVVFGAGPQAWGHVVAMSAVRPLRRVRIVGRSVASTGDLIRRVLSLGLVAEEAKADAVADADIICTCTSARTPLFDGRLLPKHAHVIAIGSHEPDAREIDNATVLRSFVVVEDRATALREAGDIILPLRERVIEESHLRADLQELVRGTEVDKNSLSLFKSVGMGWQDLAVAQLAHEVLSRENT